MKAFLLCVVLFVACSISVAAPLAESVVIGNECVCAIRTPAGGMSPAERVATINDRLPGLIAAGSLSVTCDETGGVYVGGRLLMTATQTDAEANWTTVPLLAQLWAERLRPALFIAAG